MANIKVLGGEKEIGGYSALRFAIHEAEDYQEPIQGTVAIKVMPRNRVLACERVETIYPKVIVVKGKKHEEKYFVKYQKSLYEIESVPVNSCFDGFDAAIYA